MSPNASRRITTPTEALKALRAGNERFVRGKMARRVYRRELQETSRLQNPFAVVLGCMDSRVAPELVLDQGIGDIFTLRVAGNFISDDIQGSMEFATAMIGAKLALVLGHSNCAAVMGACDGADLGKLRATLQNLHPAVDSVPGFDGARNSENEEFVRAVTSAHVQHTMSEIPRRSEVMRGLIEQGDLLVAGGIYDVSTGAISWFEPKGP